MWRKRPRSHILRANFCDLCGCIDGQRNSQHFALKGASTLVNVAAVCVDISQNGSNNLNDAA